jgi:hypothetical protein
MHPPSALAAVLLDTDLASIVVGGALQRAARRTAGRSTPPRKKLAQRTFQLRATCRALRDAFDATLRELAGPTRGVSLANRRVPVLAQCEVALECARNSERRLLAVVAALPRVERRSGWPCPWRNASQVLADNGLNNICQEYLSAHTKQAPPGLSQTLVLRRIELYARMLSHARSDFQPPRANALVEMLGFIPAPFFDCAKEAASQLAYHEEIQRMRIERRLKRHGFEEDEHYVCLRNTWKRRLMSENEKLFARPPARKLAV